MTAPRSRITRLEIILLVLVLAVGFGTLKYLVGPQQAERNFGTCAANLKVIGLAFQMYAQDYNDTLPRAWFGHDAGPSDAAVNYKWMDVLVPYLPKKRGLVDTAAVFSCPSDNVSKPYKPRSGTNYGSYVINNAYYAPGDHWTPPAGARLANIQALSATVLAADGESDFQFAWPDAAHQPALTTGFPARLGSICGRHWGGHMLRDTGITPLFCDGHVEANRVGVVFPSQVINGQRIYRNLTIESHGY